MNNELQDKQYIALELTKIGYPPIEQTLDYTNEDIFDTYKYNLLHLAGLLDETDTILYLKNENERLEKENSELYSNNRGNFENFIKDFKDFIEENKGDMEPRVYSGLITLCNKKI